MPEVFWYVKWNVSGASTYVFSPIWHLHASFQVGFATVTPKDAEDRHQQLHNTNFARHWKSLPPFYVEGVPWIVKLKIWRDSYVWNARSAANRIGFFFSKTEVSTPTMCWQPLSLLQDIQSRVDRLKARSTLAAAVSYSCHRLALPVERMR